MQVENESQLYGRQVLASEVPDQLLRHPMLRQTTGVTVTNRIFCHRCESVTDLAEGRLPQHEFY